MQHCCKYTNSRQIELPLALVIMAEKATLILREHQLRNTPMRVSILQQLVASGHALSKAEILSGINASWDRITVYRTLKTFEDRGIIHKIIEEGGESRFALCHNCNDHEHHDDHVHFKCLKCDEVICIDDAEPPKIELPKGYKVDSVNLMVQGRCEKCS